MCCLVGKLQKMKTLIRKRRLFGTARVRVRVRVRAKFRGRFRRQQIIDSCRNVIHGNRVLVAGTGYTT